VAEEKTAQEKAESEIATFTTEVYDRGEPVVEKPPATPAPKEGEQGEPAPKEGEQPPPRKKSVQERINEVTRARREAERRAEKAERELAQLRATQQQPPPKKEEQPPKEPAAGEEDPNAPKPDDYEYGELDSRYIRALASYEANKVFNEQRQKDEQSRQTREQEDRQVAAREAFEEMIDAGAKKHEDFYQRVVIDSEEGKWPLSETLGELLLGSDVGDDIAYHLATNPEEADRVYRSSPVEQARYFGRMEAKFSAGQAAATGDTGKPAPKTPKAPAPIESARGAGGQFHATADTDDFSAFEQRVNSGSK
jgi:hypothetical protein